MRRELGSSAGNAGVVGVPGGGVLGTWELWSEGTEAEGAGGGGVGGVGRDEGDEAECCGDRGVGDCHPVAGTLAPGLPKLCSSGLRAEGTLTNVEERRGEGLGSVPSWLGAGLVMASSAGSEEVLGSSVGAAMVVTGSPETS